VITAYFKILSKHFPEENEETCKPAKIQTMYLLNTSIQCYYSITNNLLRKLKKCGITNVELLIH